MDCRLELHPSQADKLDGNEVEVNFPLKRTNQNPRYTLTKSLSYLGMFKKWDVCREASETRSPITLSSLVQSFN